MIEPLGRNAAVRLMLEKYEAERLDSQFQYSLIEKLKLLWIRLRKALAL